MYDREICIRTHTLSAGVEEERDGQGARLPVVPVQGYLSK